MPKTKEKGVHEKLGSLVDTLKSLNVSFNSQPLGDFFCYLALPADPREHPHVLINMNNGGEIYPVQMKSPLVRLMDSGNYSSTYEFSSGDKSSRLIVTTDDNWIFDVDSQRRPAVYTEMMGFPKNTRFYIRAKQ